MVLSAYRLPLKLGATPSSERLGVKRERDKPPIAMMAQGGRHLGNAVIELPGAIRERLGGESKRGQGRRPQPCGGEEES